MRARFHPPRLDTRLAIAGCMLGLFAAPLQRAAGQTGGQTSSQGAPSAAQAAPTSPPPTPCANNPDNHRFDFWIGQWDVTTPDGKKVGTSHVDVISGGCALLENWRALNGGEGKSINTFDPATHQWRQFWVGQGGAVTDYSESVWHDGSVSFLVHAPAANGSPASTTRLTFTPLDSATVRQHSEITTDGGATWTTQYDLHYHRIR